MEADAEMGRRGCGMDFVRRDRTVLANMVGALQLLRA